MPSAFHPNVLLSLQLVGPLFLRTAVFVRIFLQICSDDNECMGQQLQMCDDNH